MLKRIILTTGFWLLAVPRAFAAGLLAEANLAGKLAAGFDVICAAGTFAVFFLVSLVTNVGRTPTGSVEAGPPGASNTPPAPRGPGPVTRPGALVITAPREG